MLKILFVTPVLDLTGAPFALLQTIINIKSKHPDWVCDTMYLRGGELCEEFGRYGKVFSAANKKNILSKIGRLLHLKTAKMRYLSIAAKGHYNLVYSNTIWAYRHAVSIKRELNIPLILHVHEAGFLINKCGVSYDDIMLCDYVIACSNFAKDALIDIYPSLHVPMIVSHPQSPRLVEVIKNDDDVATMSSKFIVGFAGTGYWIKSIDVLPLLINTYIKKYPKDVVSFQWVGKIEDEEYEKLQFEIKKLHIADFVKCVGEVTDSIAYFRQFSVFVLLSREDAFPLVTLESAALNKPIICFDECSGCVDWVKGGGGECVPYMDFEALADAIHYYYADNSRVLHDGSIAKSSVCKMFNTDDSSISDAIISLVSIHS